MTPAEVPAPIARLPRRFMASGVMLCLLAAAVALTGRPLAVIPAAVPILGLFRYAAARQRLDAAAPLGVEGAPASGPVWGEGVIEAVEEPVLVLRVGQALVRVRRSEMREAYGKFEDPPYWVKGQPVAFMGRLEDGIVREALVAGGAGAALSQRALYLALSPVWALMGLAWLPLLVMLALTLIG
jgi:hypothetical protein